MVGGRATPERPLAPDLGTRSATAGASPGASRTTAASGANDAHDLAGLYGPASEAWRLNREAALLLGAGPLAVLLQIAHPLVAEGVAQHSTFREDPWARLDGTLRSYLRIVYGSTAAARAEIRRLNGLHRTVAGPVSDPSAAARFGAAYAARDPELSLWVHATLVWATLTAVNRWLGAVPRDRQAPFYAETLVVGRGFGVPEALLPADLDEFEAYVADMLGPSGPVHPSSLSRNLAHAILHPPLAPVVERGAVARRLGAMSQPIATLLRRAPRSTLTPLLMPSVGLLPPSTRAELGLRWGPMEQALDAWLTTMWRLWRPVFSPEQRWFPQALAADRRVAAGMGVQAEGRAAARTR
ncbi:MAG TPA: oxygenase MpaB family protein [Candidatus Limnocylindrales bacterium]